MNASLSIYGTTVKDSEDPSIKIVRNLANMYLEGDLNRYNISTVHTTVHSLLRMGERNIECDEAVENIAEHYYIEFQPDYRPNRIDKVLFYAGHDKKTISVSTLQDITKENISLITVEHRCDKRWKEVGNYIERIKKGGGRK